MSFAKGAAAPTLPAPERTLGVPRPSCFSMSYRSGAPGARGRVATPAPLGRIYRRRDQGQDAIAPLASLPATFSRRLRPMTPWALGLLAALGARRPLTPATPHTPHSSLASPPPTRRATPLARTFVSTSRCLIPPRCPTPARRLRHTPARLPSRGRGVRRQGSGRGLSQFFSRICGSRQPRARSSPQRPSSPHSWRSWRAWPSPQVRRRRPGSPPEPSGSRSCSRRSSPSAGAGSASARSRRSSGSSSRPSRARRSGAARAPGCSPSSWRSRSSSSPSWRSSFTWISRRSPARCPSSCSWDPSGSPPSGPSSAP